MAPLIKYDEDGFEDLLLAKAMEETEKEDNLSHEEALKQIDMKKVK
jgi:hypothetical protein